MSNLTGHLCNSILVVDPNPRSLHPRVERLRSWGYHVISALTPHEALASLDEPGAPRLVLFDGTLDEDSGVDLCRAIRGRHDGGSFYLLKVSSDEDETDGLGDEADPDDVLTAPVETRDLRRRLRAGLRIVELQTQLESLRGTDPLTGSWSRGRIVRFLDDTLEQASDNRYTVALIVFDLDAFPAVLRLHGRLTGDTILRTVCRRIPSQLRPYDGFGRYRGEAFMVVLPACERTSALQIAERIRQKIAAEPVRLPIGHVAVTASFGVTVGRPGQTTIPLIRAAEARLDQAKRAGCNSIEICPPLGEAA